jgi:hypothetical protein
MEPEPAPWSLRNLGMLAFSFLVHDYEQFHDTSNAIDVHNYEYLLSHEPLTPFEAWEKQVRLLDKFLKHMASVKIA